MATKIKLGTNGNFGVKEGGTLAYNDENGVFKAIELASSRASTATYVAESGLIADAESGVPRIDWTNGVGELLLEPQSTNLLPYSEDFSTWTTQAGITITDNTLETLSPSGLNNAAKVVSSNATSGFFYGGLSSTAESIRSIYLKGSVGGEIATLKDPSGFGGQKIVTLTNEWQRFTLSTTNTGDTYQGLWVDDITVGTIYVWGAQWEELSYPTSYIRTSGSAVTRIADAVTGNSSLGQVINSSEGVLYFEGSSDSAALAVFWGLNDGGTSNRVIMGYSSSVLFGRTVNPSDDVNVSGAITATNNNKCAIRWTSSELSLWANGVELGSSILTDTPNNLDTLEADSGTGSNPFYGRIRELKVYDTALTDSELQTLTTL